MGEGRRMPPTVREDAVRVVHVTLKLAVRAALTGEDFGLDKVDVAVVDALSAAGLLATVPRGGE